MTKTEKLGNWYDKNYKKLLIFPALLLILSLVYLGYFYSQNQDIIHKDVSLTGGTTVTIDSSVSVEDLKLELSKTFEDLVVRAISDNTGQQTRVIITVPEEPDAIVPILEDYLGIKLTEENSSIEFTGSSLSQDFYVQLQIALITAFLLMALVVFLIFSKSFKIKLLVSILTISVLILFVLLKGIYLIIPFIGLLLIFYLYIKYSVPSFAVIVSAFADILMTLALVDLIGLKISTAGIVAFLMLIGYSVDTDILLTTRMLRRKESVRQALFGAFKTGTTMTLTSIFALVAALITVYSVSPILTQIFTILLIGLLFDLFNTWITNASLIKWYVEVKQ